MNNQLPVVKPSNLNYTGLEVTKGLITPEVAAQLLERNFENNRNASTSVVRRYSLLMKNGLWGLGDPIKFAEDGTLIDGQHRLSAVILAGVAAPFVIMTGLPRQSCELLDQGKKRDAANILQFRGMTFSKTHISILRMALLMAHPNKNNNHHVLSPIEIATLVKHFEDGLNFANQYKNCSSAIACAPVLAVIFMAYYKENHERLDDFLYCWHTGTVRHGVEDNAAILLRNTYLTKYKINQSSGTSRISLFNKTQSALSYFSKGECPKNFKEINRLMWGQELFNPTAIRKLL